MFTRLRTNTEASGSHFTPFQFPTQKAKNQNTQKDTQKSKHTKSRPRQKWQITLVTILLIFVCDGIFCVSDFIYDCFVIAVHCI